VEVVVGKKKKKAEAPKIDLKKTAAQLAETLGRKITDDDLYSYLMYPEVFQDFARFTKQYGDVSVIPTPAFFYGLKLDQEIAIDIEEGKTLFIKLINVGAPDKEGRRSLSFELNGVPRQAV